MSRRLCSETEKGAELFVSVLLPDVKVKEFLLLQESIGEGADSTLLRIVPLHSENMRSGRQVSAPL